ncbi:hypothetical protein KNU84_gp092 [Bacteriophage DSS3_VP1]|uniref:DUF805 domain-containing protein n=1 Tax=Bacteriophage DSS3_VP1 TaxID=2664196 RepID=A0A7S5KRN6_9CAUD|nr:hypothetical protein KNU84_gp092 [Bacteriophage DSS3_VP1]QGH74612.1 hypothetical protein DSS3VP1_00044 [Bacteriophage DSS3_VP1]
MYNFFNIIRAENAALNRGQFLVGMLYVFGMMLLFLLAESEASAISIIAVLAAIYVRTVISFKRLNDLGHHWAFLILGFIPIVETIFLVYLAAMPGKENNRSVLS